VARAELERTVTQSVLDRLIDEEPRERLDAPASWAASVRALKQAVRRDLGWLLNTRRIYEPIPEDYDELQSSLYAYGFPDISSMDRDSPRTRERLMRLIEQTIRTFEPRLTNVRVELVPTEEGTLREMHFLIQALLRMDPNPEPVVFDTMLDMSTGDYDVRGETGA
jgi:type VI secretion system protein ImpF